MAALNAVSRNVMECGLLLAVLLPAPSCGGSGLHTVRYYEDVLTDFDRSHPASAGNDECIAMLLSDSNVAPCWVFDELIRRHEDPSLLPALVPFDDDQYLWAECYKMYSAILLCNPNLGQFESDYRPERYFEYMKAEFHGLLFLCGHNSDIEFPKLANMLGSTSQPEVGIAMDVLRGMSVDLAQRYVGDLVRLKGGSIDNAVNDILACYPSIRSARESVLDSLDSSDPEVKTFAILGLGWMAGSDPSFICDDSLMIPLLSFAEDSDPEIRETAVSALGAHWPCDRAEEALTALARDPSPDVREQVVVTLENAGPRDGSEETLWELYETDVDRSVRLSALCALAKFTTPQEIVPLLLDWLSDNEARDYDESKSYEDMKIFCLIGEMGPSAAFCGPWIAEYMKRHRREECSYWAMGTLEKIQGQQ
jgi:hypothetical protein